MQRPVPPPPLTPTATPPLANVTPTQPVQMITSPQTESPLTKWGLWWKVGAISGVDFVLFSVIFLTWVTGFFWKIFADPGAAQLCGLFLFTATILLVWLLFLAYRIIRLILETRAEVDLTPYKTVARMVELTKEELSGKY